MEKADIGVIGLAVMGQNLVLNFSDHGFRVAVHNRTAQVTTDFVARSPEANLIGCESVAALCAALKSPRRVMLMVKAGPVVDDLIEALFEYLEPGDIIIDGGNSLFTDSERRLRHCQSKGIRFLGTGVSGGEEGARFGPSLMPGGDEQAWPEVKTLFQAIAAKADGEPCCQWVGQGGAGHYVKMIHNGIEYGDMQLICEAYHLLRQAGGLDNETLAQVFDRWNQGRLDSYLIQITRDIFTVKDSDGSSLLDNILDTAGQKGTGKWTGIDALEQGIPLTLIGEAVFARYLSSMKEERLNAAKVLPGPQPAPLSVSTDTLINAVEDALYAAKIISYAQGFMLMKQAAATYDWTLNYGDIALMWRGGCIIRSQFLGNIKTAYDKNPSLQNLVMDDFFRSALETCQSGWRTAVSIATQQGVPIPAMSAALSFYDGYRAATLPANLLQAQRDYFGAHTYERLDQPRGTLFHTEWGTLSQAPSSEHA